jgi:hypothetical protein
MEFSDEHDEAFEYSYFIKTANVLTSWLNPTLLYSLMNVVLVLASPTRVFNWPKV